MQATGPSCFSNYLSQSGTGCFFKRFSTCKKTSPYSLRTFYLCLASQEDSLRHRSDEFNFRVCSELYLGNTREWYKGDPRVCSVCLLHALNTVAVWHYLEKKICAVCPSISDAEYIRSVLRQKVYGLIKFNITR